MNYMFPPQGCKYTQAINTPPVIIPVTTTEVDAATYATLVADMNLLVKSEVETTIIISDVTSVAGAKLTVKDAVGDAFTNNITIRTESTQKIDGADSYKIIGGYDSVSLVCDGTDWWIV